MLNNRIKTDVRDIASISLVLILVSFGQAMAKVGAGRPAGIGLNIFLILSYTAFLLRGIIWSLVLRRHPVSRVYPFLALSFPLVLLVSLVFFGESLSYGKLAGSLLIFIGSFLMIPGSKR